MTVTTYTIPIEMTADACMMGDCPAVKSRHDIELSSPFRRNWEIKNYGKEIDEIPWPPDAYYTFREMTRWQKVKYVVSRLVGRKIQFRKPDYPTSELSLFLVVKDITAEERDRIIVLADVFEIPNPPWTKKYYPELFKGD